MDLSTIARARERVEMKAGDPQEVILQRFLTRVSASAEKLMNRDALVQSRTQQLDVMPGQREFLLPAWPVTSITTIHADVLRDFGSETLIASGDYYTETAAGLLVLDVVVGQGRGVLKVVWTGGMAATAAAFVTAYPDIAEAIDEQVAHIWQRRRGPGLISETMAGGSIATTELVQWLPQVKDTLLDHRRHAHV